MLKGVVQNKIITALSVAITFFFIMVIPAFSEPLDDVKQVDKNANELNKDQVEDIKGFSDNQTVIINKAIHEWKHRYACDRIIKVRDFDGDREDSGNKIKKKVEESEPGIIRIDSSSKSNIRDLVLHAMTVACQPDSPTMLDVPLPFWEGLILGFHGASILVHRRNTDMSKESHQMELFKKKGEMSGSHEIKPIYFTALKEGLSERNASFFHGYRTKNSRRYSVGKLARQHFPTEIDTMEFIRNNDVPGLVAIILNKPKTEVSSDDIYRVMKIYNDAWNVLLIAPRHNKSGLHVPEKEDED